jgi:hypothetical protein
VALPESRASSCKPIWPTSDSLSGQSALSPASLAPFHTAAEFHLACVDQWLTTRRPFCPVCKRDAHNHSPVPAPSERTPLLAPLLRPSAHVNTPTPQAGTTEGVPQNPAHSAVQIEDLEEGPGRSTRGEGSGSVERVLVGEDGRATEMALSGNEGEEGTGTLRGMAERPTLVAAATQTSSSSP